MKHKYLWFSYLVNSPEALRLVLSVWWVWRLRNNMVVLESCPSNVRVKVNVDGGWN